MESDNKHQPDSIENQSPEIPEPENTTEYYQSDLKDVKRLATQQKQQEISQSKTSNKKEA